MGRKTFLTREGYKSRDLFPEVTTFPALNYIYQNYTWVWLEGLSVQENRAESEVAEKLLPIDHHTNLF